MQNMHIIYKNDTLKFTLFYMLKTSENDVEKKLKTKKKELKV